MNARSTLLSRVARSFGRPLTHAFDPDFTADQAAAWSAAIRRLVRRKTDSLDAVTAEAAGNTALDVLRATRLVFSGPEGLRFHATLLEPSGTSRGSLVVLPGRNAVHAQVISEEPPDHPQRRIAWDLSCRGYTTLTLDYGLPGLLPSEARGRDETSLLDHALQINGRSLMGCLAADAAAALAWVESDLAEPGHPLGIVGQSLGGHIALHAALAHHRPVPLILASCVATYREIFWSDLKGGGAHALPGMLEYADFPDLIAAQAPAPLQVQMGTEDAIFPVAQAKQALATVHAAYRTFDEGERFDQAILGIGHGIDADRADRFLAEAFAEQTGPALQPVPPVKISFDRAMRHEALDLIDDSLTTGSLTLGAVGQIFETEAANWTGGLNVIAVSSGTSALEIALRAIGVAGKTVILAANTFFATASAAMAAGAKIDFVDIEPIGLGMDPDCLEDVLQGTDDVAAVVVVHIGGFLSPRLPEVAALCVHYGVDLVEDAAHALGSQLNGVPAGAFGRLSAFSFYPTKVVTSAEGGIVVAQSVEDAEAARSMRDHGKVSFHANLHERIGSNWRLSEIHAAVGLVHLRQLDRFIEERRAAAAYFDSRLGLIPTLEALPEPDGVASNYYKYMVRLAPEVDRTALKRRLRDLHGVILSGEVYDPPCYLQPALGGRYHPETFPQALAFSREHICLPIFPGITARQQDRILAALARELAGVGRPVAASSSALGG